MRRLIIVLLIFSLGISTYAEPLSDLNSETLAVSLVIDTSGSMAQTDPQRLRESVANVFIDYLNPDDYLGIITFNSGVDLVLPMQQLKDANTRASIKATLIPKLEGTADTDYKAALDGANKQLEDLFNPEARKIIIFLTDGEPDPDPINISNNPEQMANYMNGLWTTVSTIASNKYPVYSIGFSDGIDVEVLNRIATETGGDVRIYKDAGELDANLVQLLKSRETIVEELLIPVESTSEVGINAMPILTSDFWLKQEGYRKGEEAVVTASLLVGNNRIHGGKDLVVDRFQLLINYEHGEEISIPLYDDGKPDHSDIRSNDGIWSNKVVFDQNGKASAKLIMVGKLKGEEILLEKDIGEYVVGDPGNITITSYEKDLWIKDGDRLSIPLRFNNQSSFKETVFLQVDQGFGSVTQKQIELDPQKDLGVEVNIDLNPDLERKVHNFTMSIKAKDRSTTIDKDLLDYNVEIVSSIESLRRNLRDNSPVILPLLLIVVGITLLILLLGILFYGLLVKKQLNVHGTLIFSSEMDPENEVELDLSSFKKNKVVIALDSNKPADVNLMGSRFNYDIELTRDLIKKSSKFILGWKALFSKKEVAELIIRTTQPGIMEHEGDIFTKMNLYDEDEFKSGEFLFKYRQKKSKFSKESDEGKNVLEGRV